MDGESVHQRSSVDPSVLRGQQLPPQMHQGSELEEYATFLATVVERLNHELAVYQTKYGPITDAARVWASQYIAPTADMPWTVDERNLGPLFSAYDEKMAEQQARIEEHEKEMKSLEARVAAVIEENEDLLAQQAELIAAEVGQEDWDEMRENMAVLVAENKILVNDLEATKIELDKQRREAEEGKKLLHKAREQLSKTRAEHKANDAELLQLRKDLSEAKRDLAARDARLDAADRRIEEMAEEKQTLMSALATRQAPQQQQQQQQPQQPNNETRLLMELTAAHNAERREWMEQMTSLQKENSRLQTLLAQQPSLYQSRAQPLSIHAQGDLEAENRRLSKKIAKLEAELRDADERLLESAQHLAMVTEVAERAVAERDEHAAQAARAQRQGEKAAAKAAALEGKVISLQEQTREELLGAANLIHRQSDMHMNHSKKLHKTINHLRELAVHTE